MNHLFWDDAATDHLLQNYNTEIAKICNLGFKHRYKASYNDYVMVVFSNRKTDREIRLRLHHSKKAKWCCEHYDGPWSSFNDVLELMRCPRKPSNGEDN
jgi:hypothetical protein